MKPRIETVTIPACEVHEGIYKVSVCLKWVCPICGEPRGEPHPVLSYDGSLRMIVHGWFNPCGHVDKYEALRNEAINNGLNNRNVRIQIFYVEPAIVLSWIAHAILATSISVAISV